MTVTTSTRTDWEKHARVEHMMGMPISIHFVGRPGMSVAECDAAADDAFAELREVDATFSPYLDDSEVSRIGRGELALADACADVRQVAAACAEYDAATDGAFSAWWRGVFDPTGYVKGWAVERAARRHLARVLGRQGVVAVGINAGGDMQLQTEAGSDWVWRVGIVDPADTHTVLATVEVTNGAVATSGVSERGAHIRDPRTGAPAVELSQSTVVADSLAHADVWATAACVIGWDLAWIAGAETRMGLIVSAQGQVRRWSGVAEVTTHTAATHPEATHAVDSLLGPRSAAI